MTEYCTFSGKTMHASASDAVAALKRLNRAGGPLGSPYLCPHCSAWHQSHGRNVDATRAFKRKRKEIKYEE